LMLVLTIHDSRSPRKGRAQALTPQHPANRFPATLLRGLTTVLRL
jgi:hypothetical protein